MDLLCKKFAAQVGIAELRGLVSLLVSLLVSWLVGALRDVTATTTLNLTKCNVLAALAESVTRCL